MVFAATPSSTITLLNSTHRHRFLTPAIFHLLPGLRQFLRYSGDERFAVKRHKPLQQLPIRKPPINHRRNLR